MSSRCVRGRDGVRLTLLLVIFRGDSEVKGFMLEDGDTSSAVGSGDVINQLTAAAGVPLVFPRFSARYGPAHLRSRPLSFEQRVALTIRGRLNIQQAAAAAAPPLRRKTFHLLSPGGISL